MKQQAIDILDEMIHGIEILKVENITAKAIMEIKKDALQLARCNIIALGDGETLENIIEDIGKRMCHAGLLYPNAGYWTLQDKWGWECKGETLIEVYKQFREELKRNGHYD